MAKLIANDSTKDENMNSYSVVESGEVMGTPAAFSFKEGVD
jgi:hypothetical protein